MREVGIGKKEIAEKAKKNAIQLDGRLTEPQGNGGKTDTDKADDKSKADSGK